jgi:hypothetical protein
MKYILGVVLLLMVLAAPAKSQFVPDCSNCNNAEWGREWHPQFQSCAVSSMAGCGNGCNCWMGLVAFKNAGLGTKPEFFGGAFTKDGGFRIDRPGPLAKNRVKSGDVAYKINGRAPKRSQFGTLKRPIRAMEAAWGDDGRLSLRFYY